MIKKQQKWISLLVICTFAWLLQVSVMPLNAAGTAEKTASASSEQASGSYEAIGQKAAPAKKNSMLPWLLIGAGALTLTAVALFVWPGVLKTKYDVTGSWIFVFTGPTTATRQTDFTGTKKSGTWVWPNANPAGNHGTYTVDKKSLTMLVDPNVGWTAIITGTFTSKDAMSGTWTQSGDTWNWTATRGTAPTSIHAPSVQGLALHQQ